MAVESTVGQVLIGAGPDGMLPPKTLALGSNLSWDWIRKVRVMRRDPTLGLLRDMFSAPITASEWSVECDDPQYQDAVDMIKKSTVPFKDKFLEDSIRGLFDFGWQPFEVVKAQNPDGTFRITKYKALLQDLTTIVVDYHGRLVGLRNQPAYSYVSNLPVYLFRGQCLVLYRQVEGTNWYGEALMRRCERPYDSWMECDDGARRFDAKVAGAHWVVYYPVGSSQYKGALTDNAVIADDILKALASSGKIAIPQVIMKSVEELAQGIDSSKAAWRIELISANTQQATFVDRLRYLDSLKSRGVGLPERSVLEGQFGTKAEAEAHADFAIDNIEMFHRNVLSLLNEQIVNPLLELNKGPAYVDHIKVSATPLSDAKRAMLRSMYQTHLGTEGGQAEEADVIDWKAVRESLDIPTRRGTLPDGTETDLRHVSAPAEEPSRPSAPEVPEAPVVKASQSRRARYLASRRSSE